MSNKAKIWLYKEGNECTTVTGGLECDTTVGNGGVTKKDFIRYSSYIQFQLGGGQGSSLRTCNKINISNYDYMGIDYEIVKVSGAFENQMDIATEKNILTGDSRVLKIIDLKTDLSIGRKQKRGYIGDVNVECYVKSTFNCTWSSSITANVYSMHLETKEDVISINSQDDLFINFNCNNMDNLITITQVDILTNGRVIQSYTENLDSITYEFDRSIMDWGNNEISIKAIYTQGDNIYEIAELISDIPYTREVELEEFEPVVDLPSTANIQDIVNRISLISSANKAIKNNLKTLLESKGFSVGDTPRLSSMVKIVNELSNNNSAEITEYINRITELESEADNNKRSLYEIMLEGKYDVTSDMNLSDLIGLLELNNISVSTIKQIACGKYYSFVLKDDGTVWACGDNTYGQLGLGDTSNRTIFTQVTTNTDNVKEIFCGWHHTFILKNDDSLWGCGHNEEGQLGLGDNVNKTTFTKVNGTSDIKNVVCNGYVSFIIKNDNSLWCSGQGSDGQQGIGDTTKTNTFKQITTDVIQVACGSFVSTSTGFEYAHTVILKTNGSVWVTGNNTNGQLGLGDYTNKFTFTQVTTNINNDVKYIACGGDTTAIIKNDGSLWVCGGNWYGEAGGSTSETTSTTFKQITTNLNNDVERVILGSCATVVIKTDGTIWTCGGNTYGQLGLGDTTNRSSLTQVIVDDVKQISYGHHHMFILKNDDSIWLCGRNDKGQLGLGNTVSKSSLTQISRTTL